MSKNQLQDSYSKGLRAALPTGLLGVVSIGVAALVEGNQDPSAEIGESPVVEALWAVAGLLIFVTLGILTVHIWRGVRRRWNERNR